MRPVYKVVPFVVIAAMLYLGSGWAKEKYFEMKTQLATEITSWEMTSIKEQMEFSFKFRPNDLKTDFETFLRRVFPDDVEEMTYDQWDTGYRYLYYIEERVYEVTSAGPDGEFDTEDDMVVTNRID